MIKQQRQNIKNEMISEEPKEVCGLIMPISSSDSYSAEHWLDMKDIVCECVNEAGFVPKLVSEALDTGIIHQRIIENIYINPIIVCDISSRNPNVMFELGVRLTFDKPVVIIRDDETDRIFDTDIIEYLVYPKNLRYANIQSFKRDLVAKIIATHKKYKNPENSFFIKNFRNVKAQKLQEEELNSTQLILRAISDLKRESVNTVNRKLDINREATLLEQVDDEMLLRTLEYSLNIHYAGDYYKLKADVDGSLSDNLNIAFGICNIKDRYVGIRNSLLYSGINKLIRAIKNSNTFEEVVFELQ